jgi:hypothetical protein
MNDHDKDTLAQFANHPGWTLWNDLDKAARDKYMTDLANKLFSLPANEPLDQQELAFQRGRWRGRRELLNEIRLKGRNQKEGDPA